MVPRGSGCPGVHKDAPGRPGGVSIRVAITVVAGLWEVQREARGNRRPLEALGGSQGTLLGVIWGSFRLNFVSAEARLGSDLGVCSSESYW